MLLQEVRPHESDWITDEASGKPDFIVSGVAIGMKTVKRRVAFRPEYTAQITARHAQEPVSYFFFASYEFTRNKLWLLGAIDKESFLANAVYHGAGAQVHDKYIVRPGHEIYNIESRYLTPPDDWLRNL